MLISTLTGKRYDEKDSVRIVNTSQAAFYWYNNVKPLSIYPSKDLKTGKPILVFIFSISQTKDLYEKWLAMRPEKND